MIISTLTSERAKHNSRDPDYIFGTFQIPVDSFDEASGGGMVMIAMK
jgi:hypothetical protein